MSTATVENASILKEATAKFLTDENIVLKPTSGGVNNVVQVGCTLETESI